MSTYFSYGGNFYEQKEGEAMGSPISAVVDNLYMSSLRNLHCRQYRLDPGCGRGMLMTLSVLRKGSTKELLHHLNGVRSTIIVEQQEDRKIPFLDMLQRKREDGSLDVSVYRKPTHMDRYLPSTPIIQVW